MRSSPQDIWGLSAAVRASSLPPTRSISAPARVLVPRSRATPEGGRGPPPPAASPATITGHFPHRFPPPHGERSGTPARIAWERIVSPVATGTETPWGGERMGPGAGSDIRGGGGRG